VLRVVVVVVMLVVALAEWLVIHAIVFLLAEVEAEEY
jgi:hypothetical protein